MGSFLPAIGGQRAGGGRQSVAAVTTMQFTAMSVNRGSTLDLIKSYKSTVHLKL